MDNTELDNKVVIDLNSLKGEVISKWRMIVYINEIVRFRYASYKYEDISAYVELAFAGSEGGVSVWMTEYSMPADRFVEGDCVGQYIYNSYEDFEKSIRKNSKSDI